MGARLPFLDPLFEAGSVLCNRLASLVSVSSFLILLFISTDDAIVRAIGGRG